MEGAAIDLRVPQFRTVPDSDVYIARRLEKHKMNCQRKLRERIRSDRGPIRKGFA